MLEVVIVEVVERGRRAGHAISRASAQARPKTGQCWLRGWPCEDHRERALRGWGGWAHHRSWSRGPHPVERVSVVELIVRPYGRRLRQHPVPQKEPRTLHLEIEDEPWESQIEGISFSLLPFVPQLTPSSICISRFSRTMIDSLGMPANTAKVRDKGRRQKAFGFCMARQRISQLPGHL